jgi:ferrochelatase
MKWLSPSALDEIDRLHSAGVNDVVVLAISFVNDHIETLVELDEELFRKARGLGMNISRAASLNDSDDFACAVVDLITGIDV